MLQSENIKDYHLNEEIEKISKSGGCVINGILQLENGKCPFKYQGLCGLHESGTKPFGCIMSPFNLNKNNTLIIRHRYISMCCYGTKKSLPAYKVHRKSLELIFMDKTDKIIKSVLKSKTDIFVDLDDKIYNKIKEKEENIYRTKEIING